MVKRSTFSVQVVVQKYIVILLVGIIAEVIAHGMKIYSNSNSTRVLACNHIQNI